MDTSRTNPRHPANDPAFLARRRPDPANPANDPDFIFDLMDRMEQDAQLREDIWACFEDGDLSFLFHDTQLDMAEVLKIPGVKEFLIFCSRQLGKSFFILVVALIHCSKPYGRRRPLVRIFCDTTKQIEDIVNDNMQVLLPLAPPGWIKRTKSDNRWQVGHGEIRLCPIAAAHVDGKRGGNATLIILEEGCVTKSDEYRRAIGGVINPQLLRSRGDLIHVTTPSPDISHYIHSEVLPKAKRAGAYANHTVYDNTQLLDEQIVEAFERCTDVEEWDREYLVKIVKSQTMTVIPEFDSERHVRPLVPPSHAYWQSSLDFGGTVDKHGVIVTYWDFERAKLCVYRERLLDQNTGTKKIKGAALAIEQEAADFLKTKYKRPLWHSGDPRRVSDCPGQIVVDLADMDFAVRTPDKEEGSWEAGINALRVAFGENQVEIDPSCTWLIATLDFGLYTENRKDFQRTQALGHLDLLAALIYAWRHRVTENPFPRNLGKNPVEHFITPDAEGESALGQALIPSFLR